MSCHNDGFPFHSPSSSGVSMRVEFPTPLTWIISVVWNTGQIQHWEMLVLRCKLNWLLNCLWEKTNLFFFSQSFSGSQHSLVEVQAFLSSKFKSIVNSVMCPPCKLCTEPGREAGNDSAGAEQLQPTAFVLLEIIGEEGKAGWSVLERAAILAPEEISELSVCSFLLPHTSSLKHLQSTPSVLTSALYPAGLLLGTEGVQFLQFY